MWRADAGFDSRLQLKNVLLAEALRVTPSLIMADGTIAALPAVTLERAGVASINITDALRHLSAAAAPHRSEYGMVFLSYSARWPGAILASIQNTDEFAMLSFHSSLQVDITTYRNPRLSRELDQTMSCLWWRPYSSTGMFLFIGNTSDASRTVTLIIRNASGSPILSKLLYMAPHTSAKLQPFALLNDPPSVHSVGSMSISYRGPALSLVAIGGLEDVSNGFSANLHIVELHPELARSAAIQQQTLATANLMLGEQPAPMHFPLHTRFQPYLLLYNASGHPRSVSVRATYALHGVSRSQELGHLLVAGGSVSAFDLSSSPLNGVTPDDHSVHLEQSFEGNEDDLLTQAGSVDDSGNYVFEVDTQPEQWTISRTLCYWSVFGETDSMISLWNYTQHPTDLNLTLYYSGGTYTVPIHLAPSASYEVNVGTLIRLQLPDVAGHILPTYITQGSAILSDAKGENQHMEVTSAVSTYNVRNGTCSNQCGSCNGVTNAFVDPSTLNLSTPGSASVSAFLSYNTGSVENVTYSAIWGSSKTDVATVDSSGVVSAVGAGSANYSFTAVNYPMYLPYTCMGNSFSCSTSNFFGSGTVNVTSPIPNIVVNFYGYKSPGDNLNFSDLMDECSETLGFQVCPVFSPWNFEVHGVVPDDASNWIMTQTTVSRAVGYKYVNGTLVYDDSGIVVTDPDNPTFEQNRAGTKDLFYLDGPGAVNYYDSYTYALNFTAMICSTTGSPCYSRQFYVKEVVRPGHNLDLANSSAGDGTTSLNF